ncbi:MAG: diguanylate cyclase [Proteobacteria bacterium]|nr:diguanylate cyclase [Pseudomonadota bacterium]
MKKGLIYSVITIFLWALYDVSVRFFGNQWHVQPFVFVSFTSLVAALTLLVIAGKGRLGIKTIKQVHTWGFSFITVFIDIIWVFVFVMISVTESTLMMRLSMIVTAFICRVTLGRKIHSKSYIGFFLVLVGFYTVANNLDESVKAMSIFLIFIIIIGQSLKTYIVETHPANNEAGTWTDNCRVTGYSLLVTSFAFIVMGLSVAYFKTFLTPQELEAFTVLKSFPNLIDFVSPKTIIAATLIGLFNVSISNYFYFQATKRVGSDTFLMVGALLPVFAFCLEFVASKLGLLSITSISSKDLFAGVLIISGALWSIYVKIYLDKKQKKLAPKAKKELDVLRDTIRTAFICFKDDAKKVSKILEVNEEILEDIMTKDEPVNKGVKHKIVFNHARRVSSLDVLTGALNKNSLDLRLLDLKNHDKALVVFIDLDKFKPVNDTYGHVAGDCLLKGIAERLMDEFSNPHVVARLGGDEYCLILYGVKQKDEIKYAQKIRKLVSSPFIVDNVKDEISVGCSVGVAHYPTEGICGVKLKEVADERMYEDKKRNGTGR